MIHNDALNLDYLKVRYNKSKIKENNLIYNIFMNIVFRLESHIHGLSPSSECIYNENPRFI